MIDLTENKTCYALSSDYTSVLLTEQSSQCYRLTVCKKYGSLNKSCLCTSSTFTWVCRPSSVFCLQAEEGKPRCHPSEEQIPGCLVEWGTCQTRDGILLGYVMMPYQLPPRKMTPNNATSNKLTAVHLTPPYYYMLLQYIIYSYYNI